MWTALQCILSPFYYFLNINWTFRRLLLIELECLEYQVLEGGPSQLDPAIWQELLMLLDLTVKVIDIITVGIVY
jgi:hypothetical protein